MSDEIWALEKLQNLSDSCLSQVLTTPPNFTKQRWFLHMRNPNKEQTARGPGPWVRTELNQIGPRIRPLYPSLNVANLAWTTQRACFSHPGMTPTGTKRPQQLMVPTLFCYSHFSFSFFTGGTYSTNMVDIDSQKHPTLRNCLSAWKE